MFTKEEGEIPMGRNNYLGGSTVLNFGKLSDPNWNRKRQSEDETHFADEHPPIDPEKVALRVTSFVHEGGPNPELSANELFGVATFLDELVCINARRLRAAIRKSREHGEGHILHFARGYELMSLWQFVDSAERVAIVVFNRDRKHPKIEGFFDSVDSMAKAIEDQGWAHAENLDLLCKLPGKHLKILATKAKKTSSPLMLDGKTATATQANQSDVSVLNCPNCAQAVRVPAGKSLRIKCPRCETHWSERT